MIDSVHALVGHLERDLEATATRTMLRWDGVRQGPMREYVARELAAALHSPDPDYGALAALLGADWYPVQSGHPFPGWRRDIPGEPHEVLLELRPAAVFVAARGTGLDLSTLPERGVLLVHPTLLADFLVAFDLTHTVERLADGRYLASLRDYQGPGGRLFRRPFVYHGPRQGWSAGEIRVSYTGLP